MRGGWIFAFSLVLIAGCSTARKPAGEAEAVATGGMDREAIRIVIREHIVPIRHCYEKELKVNPALKGKLVLEWDVEAGGKVSRTEVKKSVSPAIDNCIVGVIKSLKFSEPAKGSVGRIVYPFEFSNK